MRPWARPRGFAWTYIYTRLRDAKPSDGPRPGPALTRDPVLEGDHQGRGILDRIDVSVISRYFPEFEAKLPEYIASGSTGGAGS